MLPTVRRAMLGTARIKCRVCGLRWRAFTTRPTPFVNCGVDLVSAFAILGLALHLILPLTLHLAFEFTFELVFEFRQSFQFTFVCHDESSCKVWSNVAFG